MAVLGPCAVGERREEVAYGLLDVRGRWPRLQDRGYAHA